MLTLAARGFIAACLLFVTQSPSLRFDTGRNLFILENWPGAAQAPPERWAELMTVSVDAPDVPTLLGQFRLEGGTLVFAPQFPLEPGVSYRAVGRVPGVAPISTVFSIPRLDLKPVTVVDRVYPSTDVLPENQLKFYIHFSKSMARGFAYQHIRLLDESGKRIDVPFLELGEELWDPEARRFTLFFDPGRIKRGLLSQQELGIALHEGKRYTLVVDSGWKDAEGLPLAAEFRKTFRVGPADRKTIDLKAWTIRRATANTRNSLAVEFPEPLDHAILQRELDVVDSGGKIIEGGVAVGAGERSWIFTPDLPWKKGTYTLRVGTALADLAGNMIGRAFEIDVFERVDQNLNRSTRSLQFKID